MKKPCKTLNRMTSAIVRNSVDIRTCVIGMALWMSIAACVPMADPCRNATTASFRTIMVLVATEIFVDDIYTLGECTDPAEGNDSVGYNEWKVEMTGAVGSTCTVYITSGTNTREQTTTLEDDRYCGYPGADAIVFIKE